MWWNGFETHFSKNICSPEHKAGTGKKNEKVEGGCMKRFSIIDRETNRETEGYGLVVPRYSRHPYRDDGAQVSQSALRDLALNPKLPKRALRIAIWLISQVRRKGGIHARREDIARELGMHKSDVSRGLKELYNHGIGPDQDGVLYRPILLPGQRPIIGVRPSVAWKGPSDDLRLAIEDERRESDLLQNEIRS